MFLLSMKEVDITTMRTFTKLRKFSQHYNALAKKIMEVERKSDKQYCELSQALDALIEQANEVERRKIGFF